MKEIKIKDKDITIWEDDADNIPIVYIHVVNGNGKEIWDACQKKGCKPFILVAIGNLNWDDDMSPWKIPPIYKGDKSCKGLASGHLEVLLNDIIPEVRKHISKSISYSVIAGYSLGGLFSMWSCYNTDYFSRAICASGSFWFPRFIEYTKKCDISQNVECIYFSLGDKESKTKNQYLKSVEDNTKELYNDICSKNINTIFEMNEGNHFKDVDLRIAKGIYWTLNQ